MEHYSAISPFHISLTERNRDFWKMMKPEGGKEMELPETGANDSGADLNEKNNRRMENLTLKQKCLRFLQRLRRFSQGLLNPSAQFLLCLIILTILISIVGATSKEAYDLMNDGLYTNCPR